MGPLSLDQEVGQKMQLLPVWTFYVGILSVSMCMTSDLQRELEALKGGRFNPENDSDLYVKGLHHFCKTGNEPLLKQLFLRTGQIWVGDYLWRTRMPVLAKYGMFQFIQKFWNSFSAVEPIESVKGLAYMLPQMEQKLAEGVIEGDEEAEAERKRAIRNEIRLTSRGIIGRNGAHCLWYEAIRTDNLPVAKHLYQYNQDLQATYCKSCNGTVKYPLMLALESKAWSVARWLLERSTVDPGHSNGRALDLAAAGGHVELVRYLVEEGGLNPAGNRVIKEAATSGCPETVKYLLGQEGILPDDALVRACTSAHPEVFRLLLADPRIQHQYSLNSCCRFLRDQIRRYDNPMSCYPGREGLLKACLQIKDMLLEDPRTADHPSLQD